MCGSDLLVRNDDVIYEQALSDLIEYSSYRRSAPNGSALNEQTAHTTVILAVAAIHMTCLATENVR